jgi:hypothetical protein
MAYRIVATLLSESVSLDQITNRFTAFNMLESVLAPSFPAVLGKLAVVTIYEIDGDRGRRFERISVRDSDSQPIAESAHELKGEGPAHRSTHLFQGLRLQRPGPYQVVVEGASSESGPWQEAGRRRLIAVELKHPLSGGPAEIRSPASLVD